MVPGVEVESSGGLFEGLEDEHGGLEDVIVGLL